MKWVVAFWILGVLPGGTTSDREYMMVMYDPAFERESDCELYALQRPDVYLKELQRQVETYTSYAGFKLVSDPECKRLNEDTMELIEGGPDI